MKTRHSRKPRERRRRRQHRGGEKSLRVNTELRPPQNRRVSAPPAPPPAAEAAASTQPQSEALWSRWLLALALAAGLVLGGLQGLLAGALATAVLAVLALALLMHRERHLLLRMAAGTEAMAALDIPLLILDAQDRVRWASAPYSRLYPGLGQVPVGLPYAELARRAYATGAVAAPAEEMEQRLAQRLRDHAGPGHVRLQPMRDGRTLQVVERRTRLGGWTSVAFDVTELLATQEALRQAGEAAQAANALLEDALDAMPAGFEIWDRDDRLLRCNRRLLDLYPGTADLLQPGVRFEDVVRRTLELKLIPAARGREAEWLGERLSSRGKLGRPFLIDYGGRWLQIDERRTRSGHLVCVRQDVSEIVEARRALTAAQARAERQHRLLEHAVNALPLGVEIYDERGCLQLVNRQFREWHSDIDYDALIGQRFEQLVRVSQARGMLPLEARDDPEAWVAARVARHGRQVEPQLQQLPSGRHVLTQETRTPEGHVVITRQDVTPMLLKEQALASLHAQLQAVVDTAGAGIVTIGPDGRLRSLNRAAQQLWGLEPGEMVGKPARYLLRADAQQQLVDAFDAHVSGSSSELLGARREFPAQHRDGRELVIQAAISEVRTGSDRLFVGVITDVTEQRAAEAALREANARLEHLSSTDALTGLANRRRLMEQLQQLWQHGLREQVPMAALLIDVDHFKRYNDHHGHQAGDEALRAVAAVLAQAARRATDLAARYGGEEFVLLLDHCDAQGALERAEEVLQALRALALPHGNAPLGRLSLSIGACSRRPGRDGRAEDLLSAADAALYRAKAEGRDRVLLGA